MTPIFQAAASLLVGSAYAAIRKVRRLKASVANEMARSLAIADRVQFLNAELAGFHVALLLLVRREGGEIRLPVSDIGQVNLVKTHLKVDIDPSNADRVFTILEETVQ